MICQEIWQIYTRHRHINPLEPSPSGMVYYKEHFMLLPNALRVVIGQLRVSSHQLKIENGRANGVPQEKRICRLCQIEIKEWTITQISLFKLCESKTSLQQLRILQSTYDG